MEGSMVHKQAKNDNMEQPVFTLYYLWYMYFSL
jgi:hypothetical protein